MNYFKTQGFSLLELSLTSFLGILASAGLSMAYLAVKTNNNRQALMREMLETGRFVDYILSQRVRAAGFIGCQNSQLIDQEQAISGYSSGRLPPDWQKQAAPGTDVVIIKSCVSHSNLSHDAKVQKITYFIGDTHRLNSQGLPIFGLYEKPEGQDRLELAAGVEQMQILYGVSNHTDSKIHYYRADEVGDWQMVQSVQIDLLLNTIEPVLSHPQNYDFKGQIQVSSDLLVHKAWELYLNLRERNSS